MTLETCKSVLTEQQRSLLEYWHSICIDGQLPSRRQLNPVQLGGALASTSLVEKTQAGFRFRLMGSRIAALFGREHLLEEIDAHIEEAGSSSMDIALETGRSVSGSRNVGARWHCWLRVPLLDDEGNRTLVLCLDEFPGQLPVEHTVRNTDLVEQIVA